MYLLFRSMRPMSPEDGAGDHDHVGFLDQPGQACQGQQRGTEQIGSDDAKASRPVPRGSGSNAGSLTGNHLSQHVVRLRKGKRIFQ